MLTQTGNGSIFIDEPGSYVLGADVEPVANGIIIRSGHVTLDLNGFEVRGDNLQQFLPEYGVLVDLFDDADIAPVTIRNGSITGFSAASINAVDPQVRVTVEDVYCEQGDEGGITIASEGDVRRCRVIFGAPASSTHAISVGGGSIEDCLVRAIEGDGYVLGAGVISGCRAEQCTGRGFAVGSGAFVASTIDRSTAVGCDGIGFDIGCPGSVTGCVSQRNGGAGFAGVTGVVFASCVADENAGDGFVGGRGAVFEACSATDNGVHGFNTESARGCAFVSCSAYSNGREGFRSGIGTSLIGCTASDNEECGFSSGAGAVYESCIASLNDGDGFALGFNNRITDSNASNNGGGPLGGGGAGIRASSDCTIDGNSATDNPVGIQGDNGAIIVRNTVSGNGTGIDLAGATGGPIATDPAATSNPWANFDF